MQENITALPYSLPDADLLSPLCTESYKIWQPDDNYIILGRSNRPEVSLNIEMVKNDKIKVLKRPSGGETVILTPSTLVFSIIIPAEKLQHPKKIFEIINNSLIEEFQQKGISGIYSRGISDLSIGEQKIMGSSMYFKDHKYFYHAVLNISEDPEFISKYLKHPSKEPNYRKGRNHSEFITSLKEKGFNNSTEDVSEIIRKGVEKILKVISVKE